MKKLIPLVLLFVAATALAKELPYQVRTVDPEKTYGYFVGDQIHRTIEIDVKEPYALSKGSVPLTGTRVNGIELRRVEMSQRQQGEWTHYKLDFVYQIFSRGDQAWLTQLPRPRLIVTAGKRQLAVESPEWKFEVSPLASSSGNDIGKVERAFRTPLQVEAWPWGLGLMASFAMIIGAMIGLIYIHADKAWFPGMGGPFARGYRHLSSLSEQHSSLGDAVTAIHQAFRQTYGENLLPDNLDNFLASHPSFHAIRSEIEQFFTSANFVLYGVTSAGAHGSFSELQEFCRLCRDCERGVA
jgi:mxaA protein